MLFRESGLAGGKTRRTSIRRLISSNVLLAATMLLTFVSVSIGANLTLAWNPSTSTDVTGYIIYYGTNSGVYTSTAAVGNTNAAAVSNLTAGVAYYFAAVAVNAAGVESVFSNEVMHTPGGVTRPAGAALQLSFNAQQQPVVRGNAAPGQKYELQTSTDMQTWTPVTSLTGAEDGSVSYTDPAAGESPQRFYRLEEL